MTKKKMKKNVQGKKLKATKCDGKWMISLNDLEEYKKNKYSREKSLYEGELLFDKEKGYYSINQAAKMLNVPAQKIYYATRVGQLKAFRKGAAWVVKSEDIKEYKERYLSKSVFGVEAI